MPLTRMSRLASAGGSFLCAVPRAPGAGGIRKFEPPSGSRAPRGYGGWPDSPRCLASPWRLVFSPSGSRAECVKARGVSLASRTDQGRTVRSEANRSRRSVIGVGVLVLVAVWLATSTRPVEIVAQTSKGPVRDPRPLLLTVGDLRDSKGLR